MVVHGEPECLPFSLRARLRFLHRFILGCRLLQVLRRAPGERAHTFSWHHAGTMGDSPPMKHLLSLVLCFSAACTTSLLPAAEPDFSVVPGKRVGAVNAKSTLAQLQEAYGTKKVKAAELPGPEGSTIEGAILFGGTDREMHVIWDPEKPGKAVFEVDLVGKAWKLDSGVKVGSPLKDVVKANGEPFQVYGFNWDMGGYAVIEKGALAGKVSLRFDPTGPTSDDISGDTLFSTSNGMLQAARLVVSKLTVSVR